MDTKEKTNGMTNMPSWLTPERADALIECLQAYKAGNCQQQEMINNPSWLTPERADALIEGLQVYKARNCQQQEMKSEESQRKPTDLDIEEQVIYHLKQLGVPEHIKGHKYLTYGLVEVTKDETLIDNITKGLYPLIAEKFEGATNSRVERAIRHAIELSWDRGSLDVLQEYFGYTINPLKGKPTNSEFIAMLSNKVRRELARK